MSLMLHRSAFLRPAVSGGGPPPTFQSQVLSLLGAKCRAFWLYDDPTTLWQDTSGTTAVTADTDPVGRVDDLSGNGKHALQATAGNKPAYRTGAPRLVFDGVNDALSVASAAFPVDEFELFSVIEELSHPANNRGYHGFSSTAANEWGADDGLSIHFGDANTWLQMQGVNTNVSWTGASSALVPLGLYETSRLSNVASIDQNGTRRATSSTLSAKDSPHTGPFLIGCRAQTGGAVSSHANIAMYCEIMCAPLTSGERDDLRTLINGRYALP